MTESVEPATAGFRSGKKLILRFLRFIQKPFFSDDQVTLPFFEPSHLQITQEIKQLTYTLYNNNLNKQ